MFRIKHKVFYIFDNLISILYKKDILENPSFLLEDYKRLEL